MDPNLSKVSIVKTDTRKGPRWTVNVGGFLVVGFDTPELVLDFLNEYEPRLEGQIKQSKEAMAAAEAIHVQILALQIEMGEICGPDPYIPEFN